MFQKLVNHNEYIKRLVEKGYAIAFDSNCMVIRDIPYLNDKCELQMGAIVTKLVFVDESCVKQDDHQIFFAGFSPHNADGTLIPKLADRKATVPLSDSCADVLVQRRFSNKPIEKGKARAFVDFYEKIESYVSIISGPAINLHNAN